MPGGDSTGSDGTTSPGEHLPDLMTHTHIEGLTRGPQSVCVCRGGGEMVGAGRGRGLYVASLTLTENYNQYVIHETQSDKE